MTYAVSFIGRAVLANFTLCVVDYVRRAFMLLYFLFQIRNFIQSSSGQYEVANGIASLKPIVVAVILYLFVVMALGSIKSWAERVVKKIDKSEYSRLKLLFFGSLHAYFSCIISAILIYFFASPDLVWSLVGFALLVTSLVSVLFLLPKSGQLSRLPLIFIFQHVGFSVYILVACWDVLAFITEVDSVFFTVTLIVCGRVLFRHIGQFSKLMLS